MPKPSESCERVVSVCVDVRMFGTEAQATGTAVDVARRVLLGHEVVDVWFLPDESSGDFYAVLDITEARRLVSGA